MIKKSGIVVTETILVALLTLITTVIANKETDGAITKIVYFDENATDGCIKSSEIMLK